MIKRILKAILWTAGAILALSLGLGIYATKSGAPERLAAEAEDKAQYEAWVLRVETPTASGGLEVAPRPRPAAVVAAHAAYTTEQEHLAQLAAEAQRLAEERRARGEAERAKRIEEARAKREEEARQAETRPVQCSRDLAEVHAVRYLKRNLNDPGSYQGRVGHVEGGADCRYRVWIDFSAKNGFGGRITSQAYVDLRTTREGSQMIDINIR